MPSYLYSKVTNDNILTDLKNKEPVEAAKQKAEIITDLPWKLTRITTILFLIPVVLSTLLALPIWFINEHNYNVVMMIFQAGNSIIPTISVSTLFIFISGFLIIMPNIYMVDKSDEMVSAVRNITDIYVNSRGYEVVQYQDGDIGIYPRGLSGAVNRLILGFKALGYQFKAKSLFIKQKHMIDKEKAVVDYYNKIDVSEVLNQKRKTGYLVILKVNLALSIVNIVITLLAVLLYVMVFLIYS